MSRLFPPHFVQALAALRIEARRVPPRARLAEHHSRVPGGGVEFRDYRSYTPGDDLRRLDWNLYRRMRKLFLKLADEPRELSLHLLVDMSASLWHGDGSVADAARQAAAVPGAVGLRQFDRVRLLPFGADLESGRPAYHGKAGLTALLAHLETLEPRGTTDLRRSMDSFRRLPVRPGLAVVVSDFLDPAGLPAVQEALRGLRHRLVMVRVMRPEEREPEMEGELVLRDCETGETLEVAVTESVRRRYRRLVQAFNTGLRRLAVSLGAPLLELQADEPVMPQVGRLFPGGVLPV